MNDSIILYHKTYSGKPTKIRPVVLSFTEYWYLMGLLVTDGTASTKNKIELELQSDAVNILNWVANLFNTKVTHRVRRDKRNTITTYASRVRFTNSTIHKHLTAFKQNKNPKVPNKYLPLFVAGMLFGDGSLCQTSNNASNLRIIFTTQWYLLQYVQDYLLQIAMYLPKIHKRNSCNIHDLSIYRQKVVKIFLQRTIQPILDNGFPIIENKVVTAHLLGFFDFTPWLKNYDCVRYKETKRVPQRQYIKQPLVQLEKLFHGSHTMSKIYS